MYIKLETERVLRTHLELRVSRKPPHPVTQPTHPDRSPERLRLDVPVLAFELYYVISLRTSGLRLVPGPGGIPASAWGQASAPISRPTLYEQWWLLNVNVSSGRCRYGGTTDKRQRPAGPRRPPAGRWRSRPPPPYSRAMPRARTAVVRGHYACSLFSRASAFLRIMGSEHTARRAHRAHCGYGTPARPTRHLRSPMILNSRPHWRSSLTTYKFFKIWYKICPLYDSRAESLRNE